MIHKQQRGGMSVTYVQHQHTDEKHYQDGLLNINLLFYFIYFSFSLLFFILLIIFTFFLLLFQFSFNNNNNNGSWRFTAGIYINDEIHH